MKLDYTTLSPTQCIPVTKRVSQHHDTTYNCISTWEQRVPTGCNTDHFLPSMSDKTYTERYKAGEP